MSIVQLSFPQLNNSIAKRMYEDYKAESVTTGAFTQGDQLFMGFFQNKQATIDMSNWNSWIDNPSGDQPAKTDGEYKTFFNTNTDNWRNKLLFLAGCTRIEMVEKDPTGSIVYSGQNWEVVSSYNENENTVGDEPRYLYLETDLKFYDSLLEVNGNIGVADKDIFTGVVIYKAQQLASSVPDTPDFSAWTSVDYDSSSTQYKYKYPTATPSGQAAYDPAVITTAKLVPIYQNTTRARTRTVGTNSITSVILEF